MEEEQEVQTSKSVNGEESVTAAGSGVTRSVTNGKPDTKVIRLNVTDIERIMDLRDGDEKPAMVVQRLLDDVDELCNLKLEYVSTLITVDTMQGRIDTLKEEIENLRSGAVTAIVPGQPAYSIKEAMDSLKSVCDDDAVCIKFASKMVETQVAAVGKQLDRDHATEQKRLDREDKDKDRALKKDLAESRAEHDKDMTMIKNGMIKTGDLDDIVFLGQKNTTPANRIKNKQELAARVAAHEEEEFGELDPPEETAGEGQTYG